MSCVVVHKKRMNLLKNVDRCLDLIQVLFGMAIKSNPSMIEFANEPLSRKKFMKNFDKMRFDLVYDKYCSASFIVKTKTISNIYSLGV